MNLDDADVYSDRQEEQSEEFPRMERPRTCRELVGENEAGSSLAGSDPETGSVAVTQHKKCKILLDVRNISENEFVCKKNSFIQFNKNSWLAWQHGDSVAPMRLCVSLTRSASGSAARLDCQRLMKQKDVNVYQAPRVRNVN